MMKLTKISSKGGKVYYRGNELKKFFLESKKYPLTETAKEVLRKLLKDIEYDLDKDIIFISVSEYAYVQKGYCPGIKHSLKTAYTGFKNIKDFVEYLNSIEYRWDDSYLEVTMR